MGPIAGATGAPRSVRASAEARRVLGRRRGAAAGGDRRAGARREEEARAGGAAVALLSGSRCCPRLPRARLARRRPRAINSGTGAERPSRARGRSSAAVRAQPPPPPPAGPPRHAWPWPASAPRPAPRGLSRLGGCGRRSRGRARVSGQSLASGLRAPRPPARRACGERGGEPFPQTGGGGEEMVPLSPSHSRKRLCSSRWRGQGRGSSAVLPCGQVRFLSGAVSPEGRTVSSSLPPCFSSHGFRGRH